MTSTDSWVLDASALLAMLHSEPGSETVEAHVDGAVMSSVNWSEVVQKSLARGADVVDIRQDIEAMGLAIVPFNAQDAEATARLWATTKQAGLSLGDRACIALARQLGSPAMTADKTWTELEIEVRIEIIR